MKESFMEAPAFEAFVKIGRYLKYLHREL